MTRRVRPAELVERGGDRLGPQDHPAPPPYGASSRLRWRPRPQRRRSWIRISARPCSRIRPGMLSDERTVEHRRETARGCRSRGSSPASAAHRPGSQSSRGRSPAASPGCSRRRGRGAATAPLPWRDQRRCGASAGLGAEAWASRSRAASSTTISPCSGATRRPSP
jgi:hypothetical protein